MIIAAAVDLAPRVFAAAKATKSFFTVVETNKNALLSVLDAATDIPQAFFNPKHKTLRDRHLEANAVLKHEDLRKRVQGAKTLLTDLGFNVTGGPAR